MTRFGYAIATYVSVPGVGIAAFVPVAPRLIWNASASVPVGPTGCTPRHGRRSAIWSRSGRLGRSPASWSSAITCRLTRR